MTIEKKGQALKNTMLVSVILALSLASFAAPAYAETRQFVNPIKNANVEVTIGTLIVRVIQFLLGLSAVIALLAVVVGGIRLTVGGFDNEQEAARAKKILTWAVVGFGVTISSATIITIVSDAIGLI